MVRNGAYVLPTAPGYSAEMHRRVTADLPLPGRGLLGVTRGQRSRGHDRPGKLAEPSPHPGVSQTDVVVQGIRQMIIDGRLRPGDRLPVEKDLAEALGVSGDPLREGVRALSMMGVLETRQGDGTYVTELDPSMLLAPMGFVVDLQDGSGTHHLHAVRRMLETQAAAWRRCGSARRELEAADELLRHNEAELSSRSPTTRR